MHTTSHDLRNTRKCLDCPAHIPEIGNKKRCPSCAVVKKRNEDNERAKARRKRKKEARL